MSMKQWHGEGPADGGVPAGLKACQEEVIAVTPWPGAQTSYLRGARKSSLRYWHEINI
jgi:hypothetical protein